MIDTQTAIENSQTSNQNNVPGRAHLVLFDLCVDGHHASYIQHLIEHWAPKSKTHELTIIVSKTFVQRYSDVVQLAQNSADHLKLISITEEEEKALQSTTSFYRRTLRAFQEWRILQKYTSRLKATHCLLLYFDTCQIPLALGAKSPCPFSGIYFRPTFHYEKFTSHSPTLKDKFQQLREKATLSLILRNPQLKNLLCLDPFIADYVSQFKTRTKFLTLSDPVQIPSVNQTGNVERLKTQLKIQPHRKVFLLFGLLNQRKGIFQLLEAIRTLPKELCQNLCLVLAGQIGSEDTNSVKQQSVLLEQSLPIQIVTQHGFIPEQDVSIYFQMADIVLAPYQRHVGMSGILLQAAAAKKPVLSSDYGLMGELVRQHQLGLAIDSTQPSEIAQGLTQFLLKPPTEFCNFNKMSQFAAQNSPERFAETIFKCLLSTD